MALTGYNVIHDVMYWSDARLTLDGLCSCAQGVVPFDSVEP